MCLDKHIGHTKSDMRLFIKAGYSGKPQRLGGSKAEGWRGAEGVGSKAEGAGLPSKAASLQSYPCWPTAVAANSSSCQQQ